MKKKEVTWVDFGEHDKITEEMLGLKRVVISNKNQLELNTVYHIIPALIFVLGFLMCPIVLFYLIALVGFPKALIYTMALMLFLYLDKLLLNYLTKRKSVSERNRLKSTVKPIKGKIIEIVRYDYYFDDGCFKNYDHTEWTLFIEYYDESKGENCVYNGCSFYKDISHYLRSDKVNVYLEPESDVLDVSDFMFRNSDNPKRADIPMRSDEIIWKNETDVD